MERGEKQSIFDEETSIKPDKYTKWADEFISAMDNGHWTVDNFKFSSDVQDFKVNLVEKERELLSRTIPTIGNVECKVKLWWINMGRTLNRRSMIDLGIAMGNTERIHAKAYERLMTVLGLEEVFDEVMKLPLIKGREAYLGKYAHKYYKDSKKQFVYAMILFTLFVENVSLFSQFYIILWFGRFKNVLKDTTQQVMYTKNEELIHSRVGIKIINTIREEHPELFDEEMKEKVLYEVNQSFKWESDIIDWLLGDYEGKRLSRPILKEYVKSQLNESIQEIGFGKVFDIDPELARDFEWMNEEVHGNNVTDFFHQRPVDYSKGNKAVDLDDLI